MNNMDGDGYRHYYNILLDKIDAIQTSGFSNGRIHDIRADRGLLINNIANIDWYIAKGDTSFLDVIIKRIEKDLIEFLTWR